MMLRTDPPHPYLNQIVTGDNITVLRTMPSNSVQLTVTSPPYGNLRDYGGHPFDFQAVARELVRVTAPGGVIVWVVADQTNQPGEEPGESGASYRQVLHFQSLRMTLHDTMIAMYPSGPPKQRHRYEQEFEFMFVFCKGKRPATANIRRVPTANAGKVVRVRTGSGNDQTGVLRDRGGPRKYVVVGADRPAGNVWRYTKSGAKDDPLAADHPCPFSEQLVADHIASWSKPGDVVLDPFCGSGTTCKMAKRAERGYVGIEICPEYADMARQRVNVMYDETNTPVRPRQVRRPRLSKAA